MAECGHCGKVVRGKLDHLRAKHDGLFYADGPNGKFYDYWHLRTVHIGLVSDNPSWNAAYENR
jgi:hypothetical protein